MSRSFNTVDDEATLNQTVRLGDCLPPDHLTRVSVDVMAQLDWAPIYARYAARGGAPYAPELLFGLLVYGYATGSFSSRKRERATYESAPFRFIAGNLPPAHETLATFRKTFLPEVHDLFVPVLLLAQAMDVLKLGTSSSDGTTIHAAAATSKAVSYKRLRDLEAHLRAEVEALFALGRKPTKAACLTGWSSSLSLRGARTAWRGGRKPQRYWRRAPKRARRSNRRSMPRKCASARPKPAAPASHRGPPATAAAARPARRRPIQLHRPRGGQHEEQH